VTDPSVDAADPPVTPADPPKASTPTDRNAIPTADLADRLPVIDTIRFAGMTTLRNPGE
jgi:hypothetical protein